MELFNDKSTSAISGVFIVAPGESIVFSAFNFVGAQRAVVQKVKFLDTKIASGSPCGEIFNVPTSQLSAVEDVTQCGVWALNACQNLAVLSVPGAYRLVLDDGYAVGSPEPGTPLTAAPSTAIGTVFIEATRLQNAQATMLPRDLFFGHISNPCGCGS